MAKRKPKPQTIVEQLRDAIEISGLTHYRIAKDAGIKPDQLDRFMRQERTLTLDTVAKVADVLGLELRAKE